MSEVRSTGQASSNAFRPGGRNERPQVCVPYCACHSSISASFASCARIQVGSPSRQTMRASPARRVAWCEASCEAPAAPTLEFRMRRRRSETCGGSPLSRRRLGLPPYCPPRCRLRLLADQSAHDGSAHGERRLSDAQYLGAARAPRRRPSSSGSTPETSRQRRPILPPPTASGSLRKEMRSWSRPTTALARSGFSPTAP